MNDSLYAELEHPTRAIWCGEARVAIQSVEYIQRLRDICPIEKHKATVTTAPDAGSGS